MDTAADRLAMMPDFGTTITFSDDTTALGIVDIVHEYNGDAVIADWWVTMPAESATGVALGDTLTIAAADYTVIALLPDGTGMVKLRLDPP